MASYRSLGRMDSSMMSRDAMRRHSHERFLLDTNAERRAVETPRGVKVWIRSVLRRNR